MGTAASGIRGSGTGSAGGGSHLRFICGPTRLLQATWCLATSAQTTLPSRGGISPRPLEVQKWLSLCLISL